MKLCIRAHDLGTTGEESIINRLRELDIDGVQLVAYKSLGIPHEAGAITAERAKAAGDIFREAGIAVPLVGAYFNPVHPDKAKAEEGKRIFGDYIRTAKLFGSDLVGSETGSYNGDKWTYHPKNESDDALETVVASFRSLAKQAKAEGVLIGMEGAYGHVCKTPERLDHAVRMIGESNIRIIFDIYNYLDKSNVEEMYDIFSRGIKLFGERIRIYHIKDFRISPTGELKQCGVGKGIVDYAKLIPQIKEATPDASLVLEGTTGEDIACAVGYLRKLL